MNVQNAKLIRVPYFTYERNFAWDIKAEWYPPLALGVLKRHCAQQGFDLDTYDQNFAFHLNNREREIPLTGGLLRDTQRLYHYVGGANDKAVDDFCLALLEGISFNPGEPVFLSAPAPIDITPITSQLMIAAFLKRHFGCPIVAGGTGGNGHLIHGLESQVLRGVGEGAGERTLAHLMSRGLNAACGCPGLIYHNPKDNKIKREKPETNFLHAFPDFGGLPLERYRWKPAARYTPHFPTAKRGTLMLPVRFIVGCPYNCAFCGRATDRTLLYHKPELVVAELQQLCEQYDTDSFFFLHDTINFSKEFTRAFNAALKKRNLTIYWSDCASFRNLDEEHLTLLKESGAVRLIWGLESASPTVLDYIHKGVAIEHVEKLLRRSHDMGIWNGIEIIIGFPNETDDDVDLTAAFLERNREYIDAIYMNPFYLDHNSLIRTHPERYGIRDVKFINTYASQDSGNLTDFYYMGYSYEDGSGLSFPDRCRRTNDNIAAIANRVPFGFLNNETAPALLHLGKHCRDKAEMRRRYQAWGETVIADCCKAGR